MTVADLSLEHILAPLRPSELRAEHWGRASLVLPGTPARIAGWRHTRGWRAWALRDVHAASLDDQGVQQRHPIEPEQLDAALAEGATVCGDASDDPRLRRILADLSDTLGTAHGRAFAKLYVSPPGRGYVLHADRYHVLVVQLAGRKRWWFGERPAVPWLMAGAEITPGGQAVLTHPYQGMPMVDDQGQPVTPPSDDALREVVLTPGDCLYLPPGTWHRTESASTSVALSLSPPRTPMVERMMSTLTRALMRDPLWRADLPADDAADALDERVRELILRVSRIDARALFRHWAADHEQRLAPRMPVAADEIAPITLDDRLVRTGDRPLRFVLGDDDQDGSAVVYFYGGGQEWSLPAPALPLIEGLARSAAFEVRQAVTWAPELEPGDAQAVLGELLRAGVLRRADPSASD